MPAVATVTRKLVYGHNLAREVAKAIGRANIPRPSGSGVFTYGEDIKNFRFSPKPETQIMVRSDGSSLGPGEVMSHPHLTIYVRTETVKEAMPVVEKIYDLIDRRDLGGLDTLVGIFWFDGHESDYHDEQNALVIPIPVSCFVQRKLGAA